MEEAGLWCIDRSTLYCYLKNSEIPHSLCFPFGKFLNHLQQILVDFHCSFCKLRESTGTRESGQEQVAVDQQA